MYQAYRSLLFLLELYLLSFYMVVIFLELTELVCGYLATLLYLLF